MPAANQQFSLALQEYFSTTTPSALAVEWRMKTFALGRQYIDYIARNHFPLAGRRVLDMACGWGGHALAFADAGAGVTASDLNDHAFDQLRAFCGTRSLEVDVHTADCQRLPFTGRYDVILALDLIEHIPDPHALAGEIERLLAPGGVCILTTPPKLLSILWGEPHWNLRGLSALPFMLQQPIAQKLFGREYPFPIERQYWHRSQISRLFRPAFSCEAVGAYPVAESIAWKFFVISRRVVDE